MSLPASPSLAEAEVLVVEDLGGREAVVQLDEVEVVRADAGASRTPSSRRSACRC